MDTNCEYVFVMEGWELGVSSRGDGKIENDPVGGVECIIIGSWS